MGRPLIPTRHETFNGSWPTRFERVFSPRELEIRRRLINNRSSKKWRERNREWLKSKRPERVQYTKRWLQLHPLKRAEYSQKAVRVISRKYAIQLLKQHNPHGRPIPITPETIQAKRVELMARRSAHTFKALSALSILK